jgi:hypothetical protein
VTTVSRSRSDADGRSAVARIASALERPRLWRVTAALAALLLCGVLAVAAPGSVDLVAHRPPASAATSTPAWEHWCADGQARLDRERLAYCARVDGRVVYTVRGPAPREVHAAVVGDFHLVIVRLKDGSAAPALGSRFTAVGPLVRARDGQREVQAFKVLRG